jgi:FMN phosphatase YigB (HAD superfamily)
MDFKPSQLVYIGDNWQLDFLNHKQVGITAFYFDRAGGNHQESISNLAELKSYLLRPGYGS